MYKAIIRPILCAVLVFCVAFGFHVRSAAATSLIVDDASSGANTMFPTTGFQSTLSNQNQYNGTSSFQTPTSNTCYFSFSQQIRFSGTLHIKVYAYLWSSTFNNEATTYCANVFNSYPIRGDMTTLYDQKTRPRVGILFVRQIYRIIMNFSVYRLHLQEAQQRAPMRS